MVHNKICMKTCFTRSRCNVQYLSCFCRNQTYTVGSAPCMAGPDFKRRFRLNGLVLIKYMYSIPALSTKNSVKKASECDYGYATLIHWGCNCNYKYCGPRSEIYCPVRMKSIPNYFDWQLFINKFSNCRINLHLQFFSRT